MLETPGPQALAMDTKVHAEDLVAAKQDSPPVMADRRKSYAEAVKLGGVNAPQWPGRQHPPRDVRPLRPQGRCIQAGELTRPWRIDFGEKASWPRRGSAPCQSPQPSRPASAQEWMTAMRRRKH